MCFFVNVGICGLELLEVLMLFISYFVECVVVIGFVVFVLFKSLDCFFVIGLGLMVGLLCCFWVKDSVFLFFMDWCGMIFWVYNFFI